MSNYIGPRLPRYDGENCGCGGILIFTGNEVDHSVWKCGLCATIKRGPRTRPVENIITHKDIMDDTIPVKEEDS